MAALPVLGPTVLLAWWGSRMMMLLPPPEVAVQILPSPIR